MFCCQPSESLSQLISNISKHGLHTFYGKGSHPLLWAGSPTTRAKITINGIPKLKLL